MTEYEWLTSTDPQAMLAALLPTRSGDTPPVELPLCGLVGQLHHLLPTMRSGDAPPIELEGGRGNPSERKLRLFACACCRQVWSRLDPRSQRAVATAEALIDDPMTLHAAEQVAAGDARLEATRKTQGDWQCANAALATIAGNYWHLEPDVLAWPVQAALLHEIIGNPFRLHNPWPPGSEQYGWLVWQDGTIPRLAQRIYDDRDWDAMPILGDALEEAGCQVEEIVRHCRGQEMCPGCDGSGKMAATDGTLYECQWCNPCGSGWRPLSGPHCRGCWVLDLILGKE